jgi:hypothetical protein
MAPPSNLPRLKDLDPVAVGREVSGQLVEHIWRLMLQLDPVAVPKPTELQSIGLTTALLTRYAQTGRDSEAEEHITSEQLAHDRIQDLCTAMYSCAGKPGTFDAPDIELGGGEPETAWQLVIVAAWARTQLARGEGLATRELAALASVSLRQVQELVSRGELAKGEDGRVTERECRRWLAARGVVGVEKEGGGK